MAMDLSDFNYIIQILVAAAGRNLTETEIETIYEMRNQYLEEDKKRKDEFYNKEFEATNSSGTISITVDSKYRMLDFEDTGKDSFLGVPDICEAHDNALDLVDDSYRKLLDEGSLLAQKFISRIFEKIVPAPKTTDFPSLAPGDEENKKFN